MTHEDENLVKLEMKFHLYQQNTVPIGNWVFSGMNFNIDHCGMDPKVSGNLKFTCKNSTRTERFEVGNASDFNQEVNSIIKKVQSESCKC